MAGVGEAAEVEYESDPEEAKLSLNMRRREASDEEEEEERERREKPPRRIESDGESEGQGAAAEYDDDEEEEEYDEEEYVEEEEEEAEEEDEYEEGGAISGGGGGNEEVVVAEAEAVAEDADGAKEVAGEGTVSREGVDDSNENNLQREEDKKENEPYAVPTAGAFYMHDDRFRDNAGGRHRYLSFMLTYSAIFSDPRVIFRV